MLNLNISFTEKDKNCVCVSIVDLDNYSPCGGWHFWRTFIGYPKKEIIKKIKEEVRQKTGQKHFHTKIFN